MDDYDWGNDPFEGDLDFDLDFDSPSKSGFLASFTSGFLGGVVGKTVGDTDARVNTLRKILPDNWGKTFNNINKFKEQATQTITLIKSSGHDAVVDLQAISASIAKRFPEDAPNKIRDRLLSFSEKDFSSWENRKSGETEDSIEEVKEEDVDLLLENTNANSLLERENANRNTNKTIGMMAEVGGRQQGALNLATTYLNRSNVILQSLLEYQMKDQAKRDTLKLNLLARTYLTNVKYYKFMERYSHRSIKELKVISEYSKKSDYEKTSTSQAFKKNIRESIFDSTIGRDGGLVRFIKDKFSKENIEGKGYTASSLTSMLRMGVEMGEGMPVNLPEMIGGMVGGLLVDRMPDIIKSGKGQEVIGYLKKNFPDQAKFYEKTFKKLEDLGNIAGFATSNMDSVLNNLIAEQRGDVDNDSFLTYEDYLETVGEGTKPLSKIQWNLLRKAKGLANTGLGSITENLEASEGTRISLSARTERDGFENHYWSKRSDRTLNEVIPAWLSQLHLSLEKIRTGREDISSFKYDYKSAKFITDKEASNKAISEIFKVDDYRFKVGSADDIVSKLDKDNLLSEEARKALTLELFKDADKELGLNPYSYVGSKLDDRKELTPKVREELDKLFRGSFGITDELVDQYATGSNADLLKLLTVMPTVEGRELMNSLEGDITSLRDFFPDITNKLDFLKATDYSSLKDSGVITTNRYGGDDFNMDLVWQALRETIDNKEAKNFSFTRGGLGSDTRALGSNPSLRTTNPPTPLVDAPRQATSEDNDYNTKLTEIVTKLNTTIGNLSTSLTPLTNLKLPDNAPLVEGVNKSNELLTNILERNTVNNDILTKILERQPLKKIIDPKEQKEVEEERKGLIARIKGFDAKGLFNKGVDKLLDHEPLLLGGLLGGVAGMAFFNPKAAGLVAAGMGAMMIHGKLSELAKARNPLDEEDLYDENGTLVLEARILRNRDYYSLATGKVIESWKDITGAIRVGVNGVIIGVKTLSNKLFTKENKEVFLSGMDAVRKWLVKTYDLINPMGRIKALGSKIANRFYQMDVYKEGEKDPTLIGKKFATNSYYKRDEDGNPVVIKGWNEIDGAVYNSEGIMLISKEEYEIGLRTSLGVSINKLQERAKALGKWGLEGLNKLKDKATPYVKGAASRISSGLDFNLTPVTDSVDRIYNLLMYKWGYSTIAPTPLGGGNPNPPSDNHNDNDNEDKRPPFDESNRSAHGHDKYITTLSDKVTRSNPDDFVGPRLNSLEYKQEQEDKELDRRYKKAMINGFENMSSGNNGEEEDKGKEKKGIFSIVKDIFGSLTGLGGTLIDFATDALPILGTLGRFSLMGLKIFPLMLNGILAIPAAIKWLARLFGGGTPDLGRRRSRGNRNNRNRNGRNRNGRNRNNRNRNGRNDDTNNRNNRNRNRRNRNGRNGGGRNPGSRAGRVAKFGRVAGGLGLGVAGMATGYINDKLVESGTIEEGGIASKGLKAAEYGMYGLGVAGMFGKAGAVAGAVGAGASTIAGGVAAGAAAVGTGALAVLTSPITLTVGAVAAVGYLGYKLYTKGKGKQLDLRLAQYGSPESGGSLADKILQVEALSVNYVTFSGGKPAFSNNYPLEEVAKIFGLNPGDEGLRGGLTMQSLQQWLVYRFKPVFLSYMFYVYRVGQLKDLEGYDKSNSYRVYEVAEKVHNELLAMNPLPYDVAGTLDNKEALLNRENTIMKVNDIMKELSKWLEKDKKNHENKREVFIETKDALEAKAVDLLKQKEEASLKGDTNSVMRINKEINKVDKKIKKLGDGSMSGAKDFALIVEDQTLDVKDLLPIDAPIDHLTAIRLAAYGNDDDIGWRVEAVLRLERFMESRVHGNLANLTIKATAQEMYELFKDDFRLDKKESGFFEFGDLNWDDWFNNRFTPVFKRYVQRVMAATNQLPGKSWKKLNVVQKGNIAQMLVKLTVITKDGGKPISIFDISSSPFQGAKSTTSKTKAINFLRSLAKEMDDLLINNPELDPNNVQTTDSNDKMEQDRERVRKELEEKERKLEERNSGTSKDASGNRTSNPSNASIPNYAGGNGLTNAPSNDMGNISELGGVNDLNYGDIKVNEGDDKGFSMPKGTAVDLIIKESLNNGITDPREMAFLLANADHETGGFKSTAESLRYRDPKRLRHIFPKKVPTMELAEKLTKLGQPAVANTIYAGVNGNTKPTDGWDYRGSGLIQLTGRGNFRAIGKHMGVDIESNPKAVRNDPDMAVKTLLGFYQKNNIGSKIRNNDIMGGINVINRGEQPEIKQKRVEKYKRYYNEITKNNNALINKARNSTGPVGVTPNGGGAETTPTTPTTSGTGSAPASTPSVAQATPSGNTPSTPEATPATTASVTASAPTTSPAPVTNASLPVTPPVEVPEPVNTTPAPVVNTPAPVVNNTPPPAPAPRVEPVRPAPVVNPAPVTPIPQDVKMDTGGIISALQTGDQITATLLTRVLEELQKISGNTEKPMQAVSLS